MIHGRDDARKVHTHDRPCRIGQDNQGKPPSGQVLLIAQVPITSHQHVEPGVFGGGEQVAVGESGPAFIVRRADGMAAQMLAEGTRDVPVKQD